MLTWEVPVLVLELAVALEFLDVFDPAQPSEVDARFGASVVHLRELAQFVWDLVRRGRTLPTLEFAGDDESHRAGWRSVLQGPDLTMLHGLTLAMPPIGRAEAHGVGDTTGQDPAHLSAAVVDVLVDAAVRERALAGPVTALDAVPARRGRRPKVMPAAEAWLAALTTAGGWFDADPEETARLADELIPWEEFGVGSVGPARATFSLTAPTGASPDAGWRVEFWLQSVEDPSLLISADQVWAGGHGLDQWLERPDELLLAELGRAADIYPELAGAMRQARPAALELDAVGAHAFLTVFADPLDQAGFGVRLPSWWSQRRGLALTAKASPSPEGGVAEGMFTRETLCDFQWQLALGDEELTAEELATLAAA